MTNRKLTLPTIRRVALSFPGVEDGTFFGTPAFRLKKRLLARVHQDGGSIMLNHASYICECGPPMFDPAGSSVSRSPARSMTFSVMHFSALEPDPAHAPVGRGRGHAGRRGPDQAQRQDGEHYRVIE